MSAEALRGKWNNNKQNDPFSVNLEHGVVVHLWYKLYIWHICQNFHKLRKIIQPKLKTLLASLTLCRCFFMFFLQLPNSYSWIYISSEATYNLVSCFVSQGHRGGFQTLNTARPPWSCLFPPSETKTFSVCFPCFQGLDDGEVLFNIHNSS